MDEATFELLRVNRKPSRIECIGFLQVLVSQQDAIHHLSKSVGIDHWKPTENSNLQIIRDLRNRISSHSAWSDRSNDGVNSTSMINWSDIRVGGFKAVIYREDESENYPLYEDVSFKDYLEMNVASLKVQVKSIVTQMNKIEGEFKEKMQSLDWSFLDNQGDNYLFEKLWSPWRNQNDRIHQAQGYLEIFLKRLMQSKEFFDKNGISEISDFELSALIKGCERLQQYLTNENSKENEQLEYYVLLVGWRKLWFEFDESISRLMDNFSIER
ncbi:MAG: hypothetical protein ABJN22_08380 [Litorimonas sp.]